MNQESISYKGIPISSGVGNTNLGRILKILTAIRQRRLLKPANPINYFEYLFTRDIGTSFLTNKNAQNRETDCTRSLITKNTFHLFPTLALPRSGAVELTLPYQTVHRLPYVFIIITDLDDKSKKLIQITN